MRLAVPSLLFLISRCTTQSHAAILASSFFFFFVFAPELSMLCVLSAKRLRSLIKPVRTEHDTHFGGFVSAWISCVVKSLESFREMFPDIVWSILLFSNQQWKSWLFAALGESQCLLLPLQITSFLMLAFSLFSHGYLHDHEEVNGHPHTRAATNSHRLLLSRNDCKMGFWPLRKSDQ